MSSQKNQSAICSTGPRDALRCFGVFQVLDFGILCMWQLFSGVLFSFCFFCLIYQPFLKKEGGWAVFIVILEDTEERTSERGFGTWDQCLRPSRGAPSAPPPSWNTSPCGLLVWARGVLDTRTGRGVGHCTSLSTACAPRQEQWPMWGGPSRKSLVLMFSRTSIHQTYIFYKGIGFYNLQPLIDQFSFLQ